MLKPRKFGRYLLIDRISTGGMAEVYLAKSAGVEGFEKIMAIKRILPTVSEDADFEMMFIDEAKISARLAHSNIGQVFEFGRVAGQYYIAMEYISGKDLRSIQTHLEETERVMDTPMALHVIARVCQALDYAHRQKDAEGASLRIVHRDVSPPNVIISYEGAVKLIDFGIAKATSRATRTRAGKLKGKFSYMSPEQVQGLEIDHRSDAFSLGILLHELLTNQRLFQAETQLSTMHLVRKAEVDPPSTINPEVPLEVDRIVLKALERNRDKRYAWTSELRADIERYFARNGIIFEARHLSKWMQSEFAGDIEAERLLKERVHSLKTTKAPPPADPVSKKEDEDEDEEIPTMAEGPRAKTAGVAAAADEDDDDDEEATATAAYTSPLDGDKVTAQLVKSPKPKDELGGPTDEQPSLEEEEEKDFTDEHEMAVPLPSSPDLAAADLKDKTPQVRGPGEAKEREQALVDWPTELHGHDDTPPDQSPPVDLEEVPTMIDTEEAIQARHGAISPGEDGEGSVAGALEIESDPAKQLPVVEATPQVDVEGIDGVHVHTSEVPARGAVSGTQELAEDQKPRFSSLQIMFLAGGVTLLLAGLVTLSLLLAGNGDDDDAEERPHGPSGSIIVTSRPHAACTVALDTKAKGLLSPGGSLSVTGVPTGAHKLLVTCMGFKPYSTSIEVKTAKVTYVEALLAKE